jgi:copper transport protein
LIRRATSVAVLVLCTGALALFVAPRAGAHAQLVNADPADGASLTSSPSHVTLVFSEAPDGGLSRVDVLDTSGTNHRSSELPVDDTDETQNATRDARAFRVAVDDLGKGVYTVSWRVVSRVDGHLTAGAYAFGVGVSPDEIDSAKVTSEAAPTLSGAELTGRVLLYIGLLLLIGGSWVFGFAFPSARPGSRTFMAAAVVVALAGLVVFAVAQKASAGVPLSKLMPTPLGRALVERAIGIAIAGVAVVVGASSGKRRRIAWDVAGVAAAATMFVHASAGHAAAGGVVWFKVTEHFVHVTAAGIWIGGLAAVLVGIRGAASDERLSAVRRFSTVAGVALFVVAGSGLGRAYQEVGSWSALFSTGYGRIVLGKVAGIAVLAGLGAMNRWRNVRRAGDDPDALRRTSRIELTVAVSILVLAGLLASLAPAKSSLAEPPSSVVAEGESFAGDVSVELEITPGQAGVNAFAVNVDVQGGAPVRNVTMKLEPSSGDVEPSRLQLERTGDIWTTRSAAIATPGRWRAIVAVDRGVDSVEIPLAFHTVCPQPSATQGVGDLRLYTIDIGGNSVQAYTDPAKAGNNEVHFTLFDANGDELPLADDATISGVRGDRVVRLEPRKLSPGHFVAGGKLAAGEWIFDFDGETKGGDAVIVCFEDVVR